MSRRHMSRRHIGHGYNSHHCIDDSSLHQILTILYFFQKPSFSEISPSPKQVRESSSHAISFVVEVGLHVE